VGLFIRRWFEKDPRSAPGASSHGSISLPASFLLCKRLGGNATAKRSNEYNGLGSPPISFSGLEGLEKQAIHSAFHLGRTRWKAIRKFGTFILKLDAQTLVAVESDQLLARYFGGRGAAGYLLSRSGTAGRSKKGTGF